MILEIILERVSLFFQVFQRDVNDLHMTHKIGLVEALCGFQFTFKHLDGRQIVVKYPPGKVIEPGRLDLIRISLIMLLCFFST